MPDFCFCWFWQVCRPADSKGPRGPLPVSVYPTSWFHSSCSSKEANPDEVTQALDDVELSNVGPHVSRQICHASASFQHSMSLSRNAK